MREGSRYEKWVSAIVQALKETKEFNGTLSLLLTSDEEAGRAIGLGT